MEQADSGRSRSPWSLPPDLAPQSQAVPVSRIVAASSELDGMLTPRRESVARTPRALVVADLGGSKQRTIHLQSVLPGCGGACSTEACFTAVDKGSRAWETHAQSTPFPKGAPAPEHSSSSEQ